MFKIFVPKKNYCCTESMRENIKELTTQFIELFEMGVQFSKIWYMIMKSEVSASFMFAMFCNMYLKIDLKRSKIVSF
jgi:hypothetical protein